MYAGLVNEEKKNPLFLQSCALLLFFLSVPTPACGIVGFSTFKSAVKPFCNSTKDSSEYYALLREIPFLFGQSKSYTSSPS